MVSAPIVFLICGAIVLGVLLWLLTVYWVRNTSASVVQLAQAVEKMGAIVEQTTSDHTSAKTIGALTDSVEAGEHRITEFKSRSIELQSQITALEDRLQSHLARYYQDGRGPRRKEAEAEAETDEEKEFHELMEAVQATSEVSDEPQPTNRRRRRRRKRQRHRGV